MNLPETRQGLLETGRGRGGAKTLAHYGTNKKPERDSKLGKRNHSFRLQTYDDTKTTPRGTWAFIAAVPNICPW